MDYKELIDHIIGNARVYLKEYSKKKNLDEREKGILQGLWMDIDSINNQLEIEIIKGHNEAIRIRKDLCLEKILDGLEELFNK